MLTKSFQKPYLGWPEAVERYKNDFTGRIFWISKVLGMHIDEKMNVFFALSNLIFAV